MRRILGTMLFAVVMFSAQPSPAAYPDKPSVSLQLKCADDDSCVFSGRDFKGRIMTICIRRIKLDVTMTRELFSFGRSIRWYRWEASCRNVAFGPGDVKAIGEIVFDHQPENKKMAIVIEYLTKHMLWAEPGERPYVF